MPTDIQITDEMVSEFIKTNFMLSDQKVVKERWEQFKASKRPKKEWEIIEYRGKSSGRIFRKRPSGNWVDTNGSVSFDDASINDENSGCEISSVKRLSDGEVFAIGDKLEHDLLPGWEIDSFEITEKDLIVNAKDNGYWEPLKAIKRTRIIFTTEDGVGIAIGENYWYVTDAFQIWPSICDSMTGGKVVANRELGEKYFFTKEKAEEYRLYNAPLLSLEEVKRHGGNVDYDNPYFKTLIEKAKDKLNLK